MNKLDMILNRVNKPARYIGMEVGSVYKDFDDMNVTMAFTYPDVYEIGMSYSGLEIIYGLINQREKFLCERVFAPWPDMEEEMRRAELALYTLESKRPVKDFDFFGFTFQYELSYTNMLNMMDLAGIEVYREQRSEADPIIIGGGPCTYNPEPMADFFDLFYIGEGEEGLIELFSLYEQMKAENKSKKDFIKKAAMTIEGIYAPEFYKEIYEGDRLVQRITEAGFPKIIKKRIISNFDENYVNTKPFVSNIQSVHDRVVEGIFRGCTQGCRFCQAGMIYRPIREKSVDTIVKNIKDKLESTGQSELSLSSLSTCDYKDLEGLIRALKDEFDSDNISIALPSLRLDSKGLSILEEIESGRKPSITFAPEAGSQRLRDVINKNISQEDLEKAITYCFSQGYSGIKFYFMIGLPSENYEDLEGIVQLSYLVKDLFYEQSKEDMKGNLSIHVSTSNFVPKAFTPFQWQGQDTQEALIEKSNYLKEKLRDNKIRYAYHDPMTSRIEAILAKGDRRISSVIYWAWKKGAKFDSWDEYFDYERWIEACETSKINPSYYANRQMELDELLAWDFIDIGVSKEFLIREAKKAELGKTTSDCRKVCHNCGVNKEYPGEYCPCI